MNIALMAHDDKKELMVQFCTAYAAEKEHLKKGIRNRPPKIRRFYVKDIQIVF